jgi:hypothetical protein
MKNFALFFSLQFLFYFINTLDMRAVALKRYWMVAFTNAALPLTGWLLIRYVSSAEHTGIGMVAVMLGGVTSAWAGMWLTRRW